VADSDVVVLRNAQEVADTRAALEKDGWETNPYDEPLRARIGFVAWRQVPSTCDCPCHSRGGRMMHIVACCSGSSEEVRQVCWEPLGPVTLEVVHLDSQRYTKIGTGATGPGLNPQHEQEITAAFEPLVGRTVHPCDDPKARKIGFACYEAGVAVLVGIGVVKAYADLVVGGRPLRDWPCLRVPFQP